MPEIVRDSTLFDTVMDNLKPFGYEGQKKVIMSSGSVPLSLCFVDMRYQGLRKHEHLNRLKQKWDVRKLTPIILVPHYEENRFAIVDGQGRYRVASELGYERLQSIVLMDAPADYNERLKCEAEYFIGQDTESENVKPLEKHPARVIIEDEPAIILEKMFAKYGIRYVATRGQRDKCVLGSYTDTYKMARVHGEKCLEFIFSIIQAAGWDKEPNGYSTYVMRALKEVWVAHPTDRGKIHAYLSAELRKIDPALFGAAGRSRYPMREYRNACILYLEDMICSGLKIPKRIYGDGLRKCKII